MPQRFGVPIREIREKFESRLSAKLNPRGIKPCTKFNHREI